MPQNKLSIEEKRLRKKLAERRRMAKIKNDPDLYAQWLVKSRESYQRKKARGTVLPMSVLTPSQQKIRRKKSRQSSRRYYLKKKMDKLSATDELPINEEPIYKSENRDPLSNVPQSAPTLNTYKVTTKHRKILQTVTQDVENEFNIINRVKDHSQTSFCLPQTSKEYDNVANFDTPASPVSRLRRITRSQRLSQGTERTNELTCIGSASSSICPDSPQSSISNISNTSQKSLDLFPKHKISSVAKKTSPWKALLRRMKYKANRELKLKDQKIQKLKISNERIRRQLNRLKKQSKEGKRLERKMLVSTPNKDNVQEIKYTVKQQLIKDIKLFFEDDDISRMTSGKKEFITRNKIKKQKRYLNDTLHNLHQKFTLRFPQHNISYSFFCKLRATFAFWAVIPDAKCRDTCLCVEHENMDLVTLSLKKYCIIKEKSSTEILTSLTCNLRSIDCLTRCCIICKEKHLEYKEFDNSKQIEYFKWTKIKKTYMKNGKEMKTTQTLKQKVEANPKDVINYFENICSSYMHHCANIIAQNSYIKKLKANLNYDECLIHCDFSENYNTKYATEIQSFHFGGSRQQVTLHTVVIYYKEDELLQSQCFCTISESLRHDAVAVWEHLVPVLLYIENTLPRVTSLHFLSDSPSGQYRNKKLFHIISKLHWQYPSLRKVIWNYSEKGHGKGAPDGVGGTLKRTADKMVAHGLDIPDTKTFLAYLKTNVSGIILEEVAESAILEKDMLIPQDIKEFQGTMKVHQVIWSANTKNVLAMRRLSCDLGNCSQEAVQCPHGNHIGFYQIDSDPNLNTSKKNMSRTSKKTSRPSLVKRSKNCDQEKQIQLPQMLNNRQTITANQSQESLHNSDLPDSFWDEVPSIDYENLITPSISEVVLSSLQNDKTLTKAAAAEDLSDSDDYSIF